MSVVRINTTIGTNVKDEKRYRERVREVTRIEEVSDTQDTLSFLRGSITVTTNEYGVGDGR
jgi:predicted nucleotidyltransferase